MVTMLTIMGRRVFPSPPYQLPSASTPTAAPTERSRTLTYSVMFAATAGS
jgi:hypothetical protein